MCLASSVSLNWIGLSFKLPFAGLFLRDPELVMSFEFGRTRGEDGIPDCKKVGSSGDHDLYVCWSSGRPVRSHLIHEQTSWRSKANTAIEEHICLELDPRCNLFP